MRSSNRKLRRHNETVTKPDAGSSRSGLAEGGVGEIYGRPDRHGGKSKLKHFYLLDPMKDLNSEASPSSMKSPSVESVIDALSSGVTASASDRDLGPTD